MNKVKNNSTVDWENLKILLKSYKGKEFFEDKFGYKVFSGKLDSEYRIYDEEVRLEGVIIDTPLLVIKNSEKVVIKNCVFLCSLRITDVQGCLRHIEIDESIFLRTLDVSEVGLNSINIYRSNFVQVSFIRASAKKIVLNKSKFHNLFIFEGNFKRFSVSQSKIEIFRLSESIIKIVDFYHNKLDINKNFNNYEDNVVKKHFGENSNKDNLLIDYDKVEPNIINLDLPSNNSIYENNKNSEDYQTLSFLTNRTKLTEDQENLVNLRYLTSLKTSKGTARLIIRATKSFQSPIRVLILMITTILTFGLVFTVSELGFKVNGQLENLDFFNAIYFSAITFTTIGYGDITPVGFSKILSLIEGVLGVILSGCFVVSLVRKYSER